MNRTKILALILCLSMLVTVGLMTFSTPTNVAGAGPEVWTDKTDYSPEEIVTVQGTGFVPGALYAVVIERPDGSIVKGDGTFTEGWDNVTADSNGGFYYLYKLDGIEGTYEVSIYASPWSGDIRDVVAYTTFTDSWAANAIKGHDVWDPLPSVLDWVTGHPKGYSEGETAAFRVTLGSTSSPVLAGSQLEFEIALDMHDSGAYTFTDLEPWDTTYSGLTPPPIAGALTGSPTDDVRATNAIVDSVVFLGLSGGLAPDNYLDWHVTLTVQTTGIVYVVYGGHIAAPGDVTITGVTVPAGQGASHATGVFQARILSDGSGDKTVNFDSNLITPKPSVVTTLLSLTSLVLGNSVTDTVTVHGITGSPTPTGTVDFQVQRPGETTWTTFSTTSLTPSGIDGVATSSAYTPDTVGTWYFRAHYLGNALYEPGYSDNTSEPLAVTSPASSINTDLGTANIILGQSVTDNATVTGAAGTPTGTVKFWVSTDNGATWTQVGTAKTLSGGIAVSDWYTPAAVGNYLFNASYYGDANYLGSLGDPTKEPLSVAKHATTTTTLLSQASITLGQSITDTATVDGVLGVPPFPAVTGTVTFEVSYNGDAFAPYGAVMNLVAGSATSDPYQPLAAGDYRFRAIYSGDANYLGSQSGDLDEPLTVGLADSTTTTLLSSETITLGQSITDTATVTGLGGSFPMPTGTVQFQVQIGAGPFIAFDNKTLDGSGMATSIAYTPLTAGSYHFRAVYSGDSNYNASQSGDTAEPLTVRPGLGGNPITTLLSQSEITLGDSITDSVIVPGTGVGFPAPTGTVEFQVQIEAGLFVTYDTVALSPSGNDAVATSAPYTPQFVASYHFRAVYSGDSNYQPGQSDDLAEPLIVNQAATTTGTVLSSDLILLGDSVFDTATVTGLSGFPVPTGTVDFEVRYNGGAWSPFDTAVALTSGTATSAAYTPSAVGNYNFRAVYSGDANYSGSQSADDAEPLSVGLAPTSTQTYLGVTSIVLGQSVTDNVTVSALNGLLGVPNGTVDFQVSFNGGPYVVYDANVPLVGGIATSIVYTPSAAGHYEFQAVYGGDTNFTGSTSIDGDEPLDVGQITSTTTTLLSSEAILLGDSVYDTATVTGLNGLSVPTGTVDFQVSFDGGAWSTFDSGVTLSAGSATSMAYTPSAVGNYNFRAVYSGDANYSGSQSANDAEPLSVGLVPSFTQTSLGVTSIVLGQSVTDNVTVTNLADVPIPTGTVDFQVSFDGGAYVVYDTQTLIGGMATSVPYTPSAAGHYEFQAVYGGDVNFTGSMSIEGSEPLTVDKAASSTVTLLSLGIIPLGGSLYDTATVTGLGGDFPVPTGTVDFEVSFNAGPYVVYDANVPLVDGIATSISYTPLAAGHYEFRAIYSGDDNYLVSQSTDGDEPLDVREVETKCVTVRTELSLSIPAYSLVDRAFVTSESGPVPTGTVVFEFSHEGGPWTSYGSEVTLVGGQGESDYLYVVPGHYEFRAIYSGDSNYLGAMSPEGSEPLDVCKASSYTTTKLSDSTISLGGSVSDFAEVFAYERFGAGTGTVEFQVSFNGGPFVTYDIQPLVGNMIPVGNTAYYTPLAAGHYEFQAVYSGDMWFLGSTSPVGSEPLDVCKASTQTTTCLGVGTIFLGQSVTDNATVSGLGQGSPVPTGTVDFQVRSNSGNWMTYDDDVPLVNGQARSDWYAPTVTGSHYFRAIYSGDSNYPPSQSGDFEEPLCVQKAPSRTYTCLGTDAIVLGQSVRDNATVVGLNGFPVPTGTVDFQVRFNCGDWMTYDAKVVLVNGRAISAWYTPQVAGDYNFRAIYSGDCLYLCSSSAPTSEPLHVDVPPTPGPSSDCPPSSDLLLSAKS